MRRLTSQVEAAEREGVPETVSGSLGAGGYASDGRRFGVVGGVRTPCGLERETMRCERWPWERVRGPFRYVSIRSDDERLVLETRSS